MWLCPSHLRTTLPFLDSTSALVVRAARPRFRELLDVQFVQHLRYPVVDVLRPVVGVEGQDAEGERAEQRLEHGQNELLGDPANGRKLLELGHFVDHVDDAGPLLAIAVAAVNGVDAHEARAALRPGSAPLPDRRRRAAGRPETWCGRSGTPGGPAGCRCGRSRSPPGVRSACRRRHGTGATGSSSSPVPRDGRRPCPSRPAAACRRSCRPWRRAAPEDATGGRGCGQCGAAVRSAGSAGHPSSR